MASISAAQVSTLLDQLASPSPNPTSLQQTEAQLTSYLSQPQILQPLLEVLCSHPAPHIRHLSAIFLRRAVRRHFSTLQSSQRASFKSLLLPRLASESDSAPRRGIIALVTIVCRAEDTLWPELLTATSQLSSASDPIPRTAAFSVIQSLCDTVPSQIIPHLHSITERIGVGLTDSTIRVRVAALKAFEAAARPASASDGPAMSALASLLPSVVAVATSFPQNDTDEYARVICAIFDVLTLMTEHGNGLHMRQYFNDACQFALQVFKANQAAHAARSAANEFLIFSIALKPKTIRRNGVAEEAVKAACCVIFDDAEAAAALPVQNSDPEDNDGDDEEDTDPVNLSLRLLDALTRRSELTKGTFSTAISIVRREHEIRSGAMRNAALAAGYRIMGAIADGTSIDMTYHAEDVISRLVNGVAQEDGSLQIKGRGLEALGHVCQALDTDEMPDEVTADVANKSLTAVLLGMRHPELIIRKYACMALEPVITLFQGTENLRGRVAELIQALGGLGVDAAVEAVMAVGVLAEHASEAFAESEMYQGVIDGTIRLMGQTGEKDYLARAAALEAAGALISACKDNQVIERLAIPAIESLNEDEPTIKQAGFTFFARMADTLGSSVVIAFGQQLLVKALESMEREDIMFVPDDGAQEGPALANGQEDDEDDGNGRGTLQVRTAYLDEKMVATGCVGALAAACANKAYITSIASNPVQATMIKKMFHDSVQLISDLTTYYHEDVRAAAYRALSRLAASNIFFLTNQAELAFGGDSLTQDTFERLVYGMEEDDDVWVVTNVINAAASFCGQLHPEIISKFKGGMIRSIEILISGKATCQTTADEDFGDEVQDDGDDVGGLIEAVGDLIEALSHSLRGYFAMDFKVMLTNLLSSLYSKTASARNKGMVLGAVAGVLLFMNWERCTHFSPPQKGSPEHETALATSDSTAAAVLPLALEAVRSTESKTLQRNAVFLIGIIFAKTRATASEVWQLLPQALNLLQEIFASGKNSSGALIDNGAGAIARLLYSKGAPRSNTENRRGMIRAMLNCVPLQDDPTENTTIARAIIQIAKTDLEFVLDSENCQSVVSCLVTATLVYNEARKKGKTDIWFGIDVDPNEVMVCLDESEMSQIVQILNGTREKAGEEVFVKLNLSAEDTQSFKEILSVYHG